ncbi:MAG TPA: hypothetical protein VL981_12560 [Candidatus Methylacidiphilales bacterium]|nr:hypothetical protein [Candidatus Methylacidiphilales bacterium]
MAELRVVGVVEGEAVTVDVEGGAGVDVGGELEVAITAGGVETGAVGMKTDPAAQVEENSNPHAEFQLKVQGPGLHQGRDHSRGSVKPPNHHCHFQVWEIP